MDGGETVTAGAPQGRRNWDVSALIAALIGLLALCVSAYTAYIQRQQVRAQVWPYLEPGISGSKREIVLVNKGVGPAIVKSVRIYVDGKAQRDWSAVFSALGMKFEHAPPFSTVFGVVISAGDRIDQVLFQSVEDFNAYAHQADRVEKMYCYCSSLSECWIYDDRVTDPSRITQPVDQCPARSGDDFLDNVAAQAATPSRDDD
ncbi:MAG: hypothetical protein ABI411_02540 [Tahibacter sp.]